MKLWYIGGIVLLLNIPFGYWRENVRKFSLQWILAIHLPVPVVIALRIFSKLGWHFVTFPVLIGAFFTGQFVGGYLHKRLMASPNSEISSCLVRDLVIFSKNRFFTP